MDRNDTERFSMELDIRQSTLLHNGFQRIAIRELHHGTGEIPISIVLAPRDKVSNEGEDLGEVEIVEAPK